MDALDLATVTVSDDVLAAVSPTVAEVYGILPLRLENGGHDLVIATAAPDNLDALADLGFILSRRIIPAPASLEAVRAAIERHYGPPGLRWLREAVDEMRALDSRGPLARARDWLGRVLLRRPLRLVGRGDELIAVAACSLHVRFTNLLILSATESGARETTVESARAGGRFHFRSAGGEVVEHDIPPKWARRIMRRLMEMTAGGYRRWKREGRIELNIRGASFTYDVRREPTADGERTVLRLVDGPQPED